MKRKKRIKTETINNPFYKGGLFCCLGVTIILDLVIFLSWQNICYLPINTTGECVLARSIISFDYFLPFLILEVIFSVMISILYLIDSFKYEMKMYKILSLINLVIQPYIMWLIIGIVG